jgi:hypothetical protein
VIDLTAPAAGETVCDVGCFVSELRIPDPEPVTDYVRSMSGTQHSADPERLVASVPARFPAAPGAVFTVTTHAGCLICTV